MINVGAPFLDYAYTVKEKMYRAGLNVDIDDSTKTLNKKIREGQLAGYNFILVVGATEESEQSVNIRTRDNEVKGTKSIEDAISLFKGLIEQKL